MTFKQDYLLNKFTHWQNDNRNLMAERDVDTIIYLLKIFFNFELKKGSRILDLGSGDQFLKNEFIKRGISYCGLDIKDLDFDYYQIYDCSVNELHSIKTKYKKKL